MLVALVLGVVLARIKGNGGGLRYDIGNIAVLWLILPTVCAFTLMPRSRAVATSVGLTWLCLLSFYLTADRFRLAPWQHVSDNRIFFFLVGGGLVAVFTAIAWQLERFHTRLGTLPFAAAAVLEPFLQPILSRSAQPHSAAQRACDAAEIAFGLGVLVWSLAGTRAHAPDRR